MDKLKYAFKTIVRWAWSNFGFTIFAAVITAFVPPVRAIMMQWLNVNTVMAGILVFCVVFTFLSIISRPVRWFRSTHQTRLKLSFDAKHKSSVMPLVDENNNSTGQLFRLSLTNNTTEVVEDIHVKITGIDPNSQIHFLPAELGFMHDHEKRLSLGERCFVDFIVVIYAKNEDDEAINVLRFDYLVNGVKGRQSAFIKEWRSYKFVVEVRGSGMLTADKTFEFFVNKSDEKNPFGLREVSNEQAKIW
jgi:hypothetical protein